jgi:hypothetical protein
MSGTRHGDTNIGTMMVVAMRYSGLLGEWCGCGPGQTSNNSRTGGGVQAGVEGRLMLDRKGEEAERKTQT